MGDGGTHRFNPFDAAMVAALSLVAVGSLTLFQATIGDLFAGNIDVLVASFLPVLLTLPLPAAYVTVISRERFRWESLASLAALPLAVLGYEYLVLAGGLFLSMLLVSFKTRSIYHGDNTVWTYFKATGSELTILAIVLGIALAGFYNTTPAFQDDVQGHLTNQTVDFALTQAETLMGDGPIGPEQQQQLVSLAGTLAQNTSSATITATAAIVQQRIQADGSFTPQQIATLQDALNEARNTIPGEMRNQIQQQIGDQLVPTQDTGGDSLTADLVRPRVQQVIETVTAPGPATGALLFLTMLSTVLMLKIPFEIVAMVYAFILGAVRRRIPL